MNSIEIKEMKVNSLCSGGVVCSLLIFNACFELM